MPELPGHSSQSAESVVEINHEELRRDVSSQISAAQQEVMLEAVESELEDE